MAMLIGSFLMLAIFETFFVSARYRMLAGEQNAQGIELSNALKDFSNDVLALSSMPIARTKREPADSIEQRLQPSRLLPTMSFRDTFSSESRLEWKYFCGKSNCVVLRTRAWSSRFSKVPADSMPAGESLVIWWLYQGSQPRIEGWQSKDLPVSKTLKLPPNPKGLIRTQFFIDRSGVEREVSEVILPEAIGLKLRYVHNDQMQDDWDPSIDMLTSQSPLPEAIEVKLKLENDEIEHWVHIPRM